MVAKLMLSAARSSTGAILRCNLAAGLLRLLPRAVLGIVLGLLLRLLMVAPSDASHPSGFVDLNGDTIGEHLHLRSLTNYDREDYCVRMDDPTGSQQDAENKVSGTLSASQGWNAIGQWRVDFVPYQPLECNEFDPNWNDIELRFFVTPAGCGSGASCVSSIDQQQFNPLTGHPEFRIMEVTISRTHLERACSPTSTNCWRHVISHEVGHTLGLANPGGCAGPASVMHNKAHGCATDELWPTTADKESVVSLMPIAGGGGGGGGGTKATYF